MTNLRTIWVTEPQFSDWLASDDGLALIAEDIGIEVEDPIRESRPGDYPCDIVGHLLGEESHIVIIENQFGKTDHDHLGKILTYAAMHAAMTGIWIAEKASDDHRKVIDWLNDNTNENVSLYLVEIEAFRIGNSDVAPQFNVVSRPNIQVKLQRREKTDAESARSVWLRDYWEEILTYIKEQKPPFRTQSPSNDHWSSIRLGRSDFRLALMLIASKGCIRCEMTFDPLWKQAAYAQLEAERATIEAEIGANAGEKFSWEPRPGKKSAAIQLEAPINPKEDTNREAIKVWMYEKSVAFYKAFHNRVKKLKAPIGIDEMESEEN